MMIPQVKFRLNICVTNVLARVVKVKLFYFKTFRPPKPPIVSPEMYRIKSINVVGDYAIKISWKDGHDTGIYSWTYLKTLESGQANSTNQKYDTLL